MVTVLRDVILRVGDACAGALGSMLAFLGITEAQGRGGLHLHGNGWGKITADDITRYADDDSTMKFIPDGLKRKRVALLNGLRPFVLFCQFDS
jgi:hypothetical protein